MDKRILFSISVEMIGNILGFLFLQGAPLYCFAVLSLATFLLIICVGSMDPGALVMRNSSYYRMALFDGYSYKNIEEKNVTSGRLFMKKGKILHSEVFCNTCGIFRPSGTSHCRACNRCISSMDHHCIWLSNCIGENNYPYFMNLLSLEALRSILVLAVRFNQTFPNINRSLECAFFYSTLFATSVLSVFIMALFFYFLWLNIRGDTSRSFCKRTRTHSDSK